MYAYRVFKTLTDRDVQDGNASVETKQQIQKSSSTVTVISSTTPRRILLAAVSSLFLLVIGWSPALWSQAVSATLVGTVTDNSGAVVSNATVTIVENATGIVHTSLTNPSGNYTFPNLKPGSYNVTISGQGFKKETRTGVDVAVNTTTRVDITLQPGNITETVTVTGAPPIMETDRADVSTNIEAETLSTMPVMVNQNFQSLLTLAPGVGPPVFQHSQFFNAASSIQTEVNGQPRMGNSYQIEGVDDDERTGLLQIMIPPEQAIQTVDIATSNYEAELGRAIGTVSNVILKSGTNQFHGLATEYVQNSAVDARAYFNPSVGHISYNYFGGALGGPIKKDKLFFFGDFFRSPDHEANSNVLTIPSPTWYTCNGSGYIDLSGALTSTGKGQIYDPATGNSSGQGRTPYPNNQIPCNAAAAAGEGVVTYADPVSLKLMSLLKAPNNGNPATWATSSVSNDYSANLPFQKTTNRYDGKIDYQVSGKDHLSYRYEREDVTIFQAPVWGPAGGGPAQGAFEGTGKQNVYSTGLNYDRAFSSTLLTEARFGVAHYGNSALPSDYGSNDATNSGVPGVNISKFTSGQVGIFLSDFSGNPLIGYSASVPWVRTETNVDAVNHWTKIVRNHVALLLVTFSIYAQVRHFDFVNYDDPDYTTGNVHVRQGLTAQGLAWALTSRDAANWFPVTWVSHMLDWQFFGSQSGWHHLHNVLLHALAAIFLCIFLQRATGARWRSALVAFFFALHPLHVESVAWVAERKDVLSACFWFLTLCAYAWYVEHPGWARYLAVASLLCLGLMAKPMVVTLPLVLLLLDYWPLARLREQRRKVIWEKLPLLALSSAAATITYLVQQHAGAVKALPLATRVANATLSCVMYILKTFWPSRLAVFYPYPHEFAFVPLLTAGLLLAGLTASVIRLRRCAPYLLTGWGWFLVTLLPVIGLVQAGGQARADRYMYIPMVGLLIMVVWGTAEIFERSRATAVAFLLAGTACLACAALTWIQVGYWRNSETLFRHALEVTEDNSVANHNLGSYLMASPGRLSEAFPYLETAVNLDPDSPPAHADLGSALAKAGRFPEAIAQFEAAIHLAPDAPIPHNNLGSALTETGHMPEAIAEFQTALRLDPNYEEARRNLAVAQAGDSGSTHASRGIALLKAGDPNRAIAELQIAVRLEPNDADTQNNLGVALSRIPERQSESIAHFEAAIRLRPDFADAHYNLGVALSGIPGRLSEAVHHLEEADRLRPDPALERAIAQLRAERQ